MKPDLSAAPRSGAPLADAPRVLVAIASYGTAQDHYLARLLAEYRKSTLPMRVVVLSNAPKPVEGAEVLVGLPSRDSYSLPFAHKKLFAENVENFDLFIYAEDDTLLTEDHIRAFLDAQSKLNEDEIPGFVRSETTPDDRRLITSVNTLFRWLPDSVVERGGELFARFSNEHSGCFIVTQRQLRLALDSGGFLVAPHSERYGMLETAASDIYTQCGLRRLVSLSRIQDFIVPHLANKYYNQMGIPVEELLTQVQALDQLRTNGGWTGKLFDPASEMTGFRCSKNLYERGDRRLLQTIPAAARSVLSLGCGWGENEEWLQSKGIGVCAVPLDAVLAASVSKRGIRTVVGPFEEAMRRIGNEQFDVVLLADVLHLVDQPVEWLRASERVLAPGGRVVARVPNTGEIVGRLRDFGAGKRVARAVSASRIKQWCRSAGLRALSIDPYVEEARRPLRKWVAQNFGSVFASGFTLVAERQESRP